MKHLDIFSGIGGFALAARRVGWETVGFCEIDSYCQKVLAKHWPGVPIYEDVRELTGETVGNVDIITSGFPCQDISLAGQGGWGTKGIDGPRSGLWSETVRLIGELRPQYAVMENVAALLGRGMDKVLGDLSEIGYDAEWEVIPAGAIGAGQLRERVWISTYPNSNGLQRRVFGAKTFWRSAALVDCHVWDNIPVAPGYRSRNGVPNLVDRTRGLGNAIVPQVAEVIFRAIDSNPLPLRLTTSLRSDA